MRVQEMQDLLARGDEIVQMMQVTGEEGVVLDDFVTHQKAYFVDMVYIQQDAFDSVDASVPLERQRFTFNKIYDIVNRNYNFKDKDSARNYFTRLTGLFKNFNYAAHDTPDYNNLLNEINGLLAQVD